MKYRFGLQKGLGLLDLSIAMVIISLIFMAVPNVWTQTTQAKGRISQDLLMLQLEESMHLFLRINGFLPCPDTNGDGHESRNTNGTCKDREGGLPYADFGFSEADAWGNPWYYRVHQRTESSTYINRVCEPTSVFASSGSEDLTDFWLCPETETFYCKSASSASNCDSVCNETCVDNVSAHPTDFQNRPPYYHLSTRPVGTLKVSYGIEIQDANFQPIEEGAIATVISWGENGLGSYALTCSQSDLTTAEQENCDGDTDFVFDEPSRNKDYVLWFDMNQAKYALIQSGRLQ